MADVDMGLMLSMREILTNTIDADPTEYRGNLMRSRLEADFARHLDEQGISDWQYEPQTFGPRGRGYIPDFLIRSGTTGRTYVELKPTIEQAEAAKARMEVIWELYPSAVLLVVSAEGSRWFARVRGAEWESWHERWNHAS